MKCLSCHFEHESKFCPNCGEKAEVRKITFSSIFEDAFSTVSNMDRGFLYNIKNLTTKPHKVITSYIAGKRKNILNPISFLILSLAIYIIAESTFKNLFDLDFIDPSVDKEDWGYKVGRFIKIYFNYFWGLSVLWLSVFTRAFFGRYNFAEHLTINSFIIAQATLVGTLTYLVYQLPIMVDPIAYVIIIVLVYQVFKKEDTKVFVFFKTILTVILFHIVMLLITVAIGFLINEFQSLQV